MNINIKWILIIGLIISEYAHCKSLGKKEFSPSKEYYSRDILYLKSDSVFPNIERKKIIRNIEFCYTKENKCNKVFDQDTKHILNTRLIDHKSVKSEKRLRIYIYQSFDNDSNLDGQIDHLDLSDIYVYIPDTKNTVLISKNVSNFSKLRENINGDTFYLWLEIESKLLVYEYELTTGTLINKYIP